MLTKKNFAHNTPLLRGNVGGGGVGIRVEAESDTQMEKESEKFDRSIASWYPFPFCALEAVNKLIVW